VGWVCTTNVRSYLWIKNLNVFTAGFRHLGITQFNAELSVVWLYFYRPISNPTRRPTQPTEKSGLPSRKRCNRLKYTPPRPDWETDDFDGHVPSGCLLLANKNLSLSRAKYDSRKLTGRFAQQGMIRAILWMFCASKLLCCVSFKLRFNYFIYLIYQLFVWVLLVVDVNLGYMHYL